MTSLITPPADPVGEIAAVLARPDPRDMLAARFAGYFAGHGLAVVAPAPIVTDDDSLLFTNATIVPLKAAIEHDEIPDGGVYVRQPCLRTRNAALIRAGQQPEYLSSFTMLGIYLPASWSHRRVVDLVRGYLVEEEQLDPDRMALHTNPATAFLRQEWADAVPGSPILEGRHSASYYRWTYGKDDWWGDGVTVALRQHDGTWQDIGNIIVMRAGDRVLGYEFGFGEETFLARRHGVGSPYLFAGLHHIFPPDAVQPTPATQDCVMTLAHLFHAGVAPGRGSRGSIVRTTVNNLLSRLEAEAITLDAALEWLRAYTVTAFGPYAEDSERILRSYSAARIQRIERFGAYAGNQVRLDVLRGPDLRAALTLVGTRRYGLDDLLTARILDTILEDVP